MVNKQKPNKSGSDPEHLLYFKASLNFYKALRARFDQEQLLVCKAVRVRVQLEHKLVIRLSETNPEHLLF